MIISSWLLKMCCFLSFTLRWSITLILYSSVHFGSMFEEIADCSTFHTPNCSFTFNLALSLLSLSLSLSLYREHESQCGYAPVRCPNNPDCPLVLKMVRYANGSIPLCCSKPSFLLSPRVRLAERCSAVREKVLASFLLTNCGLVWDYFHCCTALTWMFMFIYM